ncbi:MAG: GNAT family N-acetyltransferase [Streptosporangiaceae bacterium]
MTIRVRTGSDADVAALLPLYDEAVQWLTAQGRQGQWGTQLWSRRPELVARLDRVARNGELRVAETGTGDLAGALWLTSAPGYAPAASEPEVYLEGFVVARRFAGCGVGQVLLEAARSEAAGRGVRQLRLDCWGRRRSGPGPLLRAGWLHRHRPAHRPGRGRLGGCAPGSAPDAYSMRVNLYRIYALEIHSH